MPCYWWKSKPFTATYLFSWGDVEMHAPLGSTSVTNCHTGLFLTVAAWQGLMYCTSSYQNPKSWWFILGVLVSSKCHKPECGFHKISRRNSIIIAHLIKTYKKLPQRLEAKSLRLRVSLMMPMHVQHLASEVASKSVEEMRRVVRYPDSILTEILSLADSNIMP